MLKTTTTTKPTLLLLSHIWGSLPGFLCLNGQSKKPLAAWLFCHLYLPMYFCLRFPVSKFSYFT